MSRHRIREQAVLRANYVGRNWVIPVVLMFCALIVSTTVVRKVIESLAKLAGML